LRRRFGIWTLRTTTVKKACGRASKSWRS
jgi:hypothetical protein